MPDLEEEKVKLYKRLTETLEEIDNNYYDLRNTVQANHKYINELRDDIGRWKETCFRQSEHIHKLYLIGAIQLIIITGLGIWVSTLLIFH